MSAKRSGLSGQCEGEAAQARGRPARRKPVFRLTPKQVIKRCREKGHCDMCAGHVLALMALMVDREWNISQLAEHSRVARPTISEMLILKKCASTNTRNQLAETFGMRLFAFELLAHFSVRAEVSP